jgi:hypothetical protein
MFEIADGIDEGDIIARRVLDPDDTIAIVMNRVTDLLRVVGTKSW